LVGLGAKKTLLLGGLRFGMRKIRRGEIPKWGGANSIQSLLKRREGGGEAPPRGENLGHHSWPQAPEKEGG